MTDSNAEKSKLIIDEDWKSQVEAEKERLQKVRDETPAASAPGNEPSSSSGGSGSSGEPDAVDGIGLPPASFVSLLTMLATQAMMCLGQIADPQTGKPILALDQAKHFIDTCEMLEQKTKGNLSAEESALLENVLHELRMAYVAVGRQASPAK